MLALRRWELTAASGTIAAAVTTNNRESPMNHRNGVRTSHLLSTLSSALLMTLATGARAAEGAPTPRADGTPVDVEVFKGPKMIKTLIPGYPVAEQQNGNEGWVRVNMMIDPRGKPYEIMVVESTGNRTFEKTAVKAVENWTFEPATRAGTPIDASFDVKVKFYLDQPASGANRQFVSAYKKLLQAIEANDRTAADSELAQLKVQNLYEDAYFNLAHFHYHHKWGTEQEELHDLRGAVAAEKTAQYLDKKTFVAAMGRLLVLEVKTQDFGNALQTWKVLRPLVSKQDLPEYQKVIDQVEALRKNDQLVRIAAQLSELNSWNGALFKKRFQVVVASGRVSEIKLRCEKQYLLFRYEPGLQYKVDGPSGDCTIELVGDPGTKFELIQS